MLRLAPLWLAVAAAGALLWSLARPARTAWWARAAAAALWIGLAIGVVVQLRLGEIARDWPRLRGEVEERAAAAIAAALDDLVDRGERAVEGAAPIAGAPDAGLPRQLGFARLEELRRRTKMSALAIYGADLDPIVWAGEHRGLIPEFVRRGEREYAFHRGPLFGYLYFIHPLSGGRTAIAAVLLDSSIRIGGESTPFAERFAARHGIVPRFMVPARAEGEAVWDWATDVPILSVAFGPVSQEAWHARVAGQGRRGVALAWAAAFLLLCVGWYRRRVGPPGVPVLLGTAALLVLPLRAMLDAEALFSPLHFVIPAPGDLALGRLLILLSGLGVWVLTRQAGRSHAGRHAPLALCVALAALLVPLGLELIRRSASLGLLALRPAGGATLILAAALLLALPLFVLLRAPAPSPRRRPAALPALLGSGLAAALAVGLLLVWHPERPPPIALTALWAAPFAAWAVAISRVRRSRTLLAWLAAAWLGGTAAAAYLWTLHLDARIDRAETELSHLGTEADPFLDYLLRQFAEQTLALADEGETGVNLLYRSWVASGLGREGYEARITVWSGDEPEAELRLSELELAPAFVADMLARARSAGAPLLERYTEQEQLHYLLLVPLPDGRVVSVATPPRRRLGRATPLARFLHADDRLVDDEYEALTLLPPAANESLPRMHTAVEPGEVRWVRVPEGWRSETTVQFPTGPLHAHLLVRAPSAWVLLVRGLLVQALVLASCALLWALARSLCGEPLGLTEARWEWVRTFRGRLTLALFGFFLFPTLVFGAVAYRTIAQELVRTGGALARHSLELAAPAVATEPLAELGGRVRADLLLYRDGALAGASATELLELGLFQTWLPPGVATAFASGEYTEAQEQRRLAGSRYLVAYRRIADDAVLAVPSPLASGEIARRQREFAHAFLLMTLLGAGLSVVLALLVGRALSQPIDLLSRAALAVGGGNLRLRLPEDRPDEFGGVYRAFNRMVRRLRRARAAELRTARVLAWGQMARQVAHEIKNPLTPIKLSVQHLRRAYADRRPDFPQILERNVEAILREIDRLSEIARAFARFGAPREAAGGLEPLDLEQIVTETLVLYRGGNDGIDYRAEIAPDVPRVLARDGELREVLLNLLENAREAVDGAGEILITASTLDGGAWVRLDVADSGTGIPPEQLPQIFEPHFSTRSSGTGLGLAIVRRLVESWGGEVTATSTPGRGTTVHLRLRAA